MAVSGTEPPEEAGKMGMDGEDIGKGGSGLENGGDVLCGGGASGANFWVQDMGYETPVGEIQ